MGHEIGASKPITYHPQAAQSIIYVKLLNRFDSVSVCPTERLGAIPRNPRKVV